MDLTTFTVIGLLVSVLVVAQNLLRYARAKDWNGVAGITLACVLGVGVAMLAASADITSSLVLVDGAEPLGDQDAASLVLIGIALGTTGSFAIDALKAFNSSDSAKKPPLVPQDDGS